MGISVQHTEVLWEDQFYQYFPMPNSVGRGLSCSPSPQ